MEYSFQSVILAPEPRSSIGWLIAVVLDLGGTTEVLIPSYSPNDEELGGEGRGRFISIIRDRLSKSASDDNRLSGLGPYCVIRDSVAVTPEQVEFLRLTVEGWGKRY